MVLEADYQRRLAEALELNLPPPEREVNPWLEMLSPRSPAGRRRGGRKRHSVLSATSAANCRENRVRLLGMGWLLPLTLLGINALCYAALLVAAKAESTPQSPDAPYSPRSWDQYDYRRFEDWTVRVALLSAVGFWLAATAATAHSLGRPLESEWLMLSVVPVAAAFWLGWRGLSLRVEAVRLAASQSRPDITAQWEARSEAWRAARQREAEEEKARAQRVSLPRPPTPPAGLNVRLMASLLAQFETELLRRHPAAAAQASKDRGMIAVLHDYPDVTVGGLTFWDAYEDAMRKIAERAPLRVKRGDYVNIAGRVFRLGNVDEAQRRVTTERLDEAGHVISSCPCDADYPDGTALESITPEASALGDWPPCPEHMTDALARARFVSRQHDLHLVRAGLVEDDD